MRFRWRDVALLGCWPMRSFWGAYRRWPAIHYGHHAIEATRIPGRGAV